MYWLYLLLRLKVTIDNPQTMQVIKAQSQLSQVKLNILLRKHDLKSNGKK